MYNLPISWFLSSTGAGWRARGAAMIFSAVVAAPHQTVMSSLVQCNMMHSFLKSHNTEKCCTSTTDFWKFSCISWGLSFYRPYEFICSRCLFPNSIFRKATCKISSLCFDGVVASAKRDTAIMQAHGWVQAPLLHFLKKSKFCRPW